MPRHILFRVNDPNDKAASKAAADKVKNTIERIKKGRGLRNARQGASRRSVRQAGGGDLGYLPATSMVPEFSEVAFSLEKGQVVRADQDPVSAGTSSGRGQAHARAAAVRQVRGEIEQFASRKAQVGSRRQAAGRAKIERLDKAAEPKK